MKKAYQNEETVSFVKIGKKHSNQRAFEAKQKSLKHTAAVKNYKNCRAVKHNWEA